MFENIIDKIVVLVFVIFVNIIDIVVIIVVFENIIDYNSCI